MASQSLEIVIQEPSAAVERLRGAQAEGAVDAEIWLLRASASLCALFADERCFLMLLRYDGDAGFSSRNLELEPDDALTTAFTLSNGQVDDLPLHWTHPAAAGWAALERFAETGRLPSSMGWFNDSRDGSAPPL